MASRIKIRALLLVLLAVLGVVYALIHTQAPPREPAPPPVPTDTMLEGARADTLELPPLAELPPEAPAPLPGAVPEPPSGVIPEVDAPAPARSEQPVPTPPAPPPEVREPSALHRASFSLKVRDLVNPYRVLGLFVMPGEILDLEALHATHTGAPYRLRAASGEAERVGEGRWLWTAPGEPGLYTLVLGDPHDAVQLNIFVLTPFDHATADLQGYRIGAYEREPLRGSPRFAPPPGFFEVTAGNADVPVSPHFSVGMFTSKQSAAFPKYVVLDERLLLKLEMLLEEVVRRGVPASSFVIMSGFRTPYYNKRIGNTTRYSQHLYGRAADVYIDDDGDGTMDDLDGNGTVGLGDARTLYRLVDDLRGAPWYAPFLGGLGLYGPKPHRGPFIHVDVRGYVARW